MCVPVYLFIHKGDFSPVPDFCPTAYDRRYLTDRHYGSTRGASDVLDLPARESSRASPAPHVLAWTSADPADPPPGRTSFAKSRVQPFLFG